MPLGHAICGYQGHNYLVTLLLWIIQINVIGIQITFSDKSTIGITCPLQLYVRYTGESVLQDTSLLGVGTGGLVPLWPPAIIGNDTTPWITFLSLGPQIKKTVLPKGYMNPCAVQHCEYCSLVSESTF